MKTRIGVLAAGVAGLAAVCGAAEPKVHDMFAPYLKQIKNETALFHFQGVMGLAEKGQ